MIETIDITDMPRAEWLKLRESVLTASDISAAAGIDPNKSRRRLYFEKGRFPGMELPNAAETGFMRRGRRWEPAVFASLAEERPDLQINRPRIFVRDMELRIGCTPDGFAAGHPRGLAVIETKTCMPHIYKRDWSQEDQRAPIHAVLQCQTAMMLTGAAVGLCCAIPMSPYDTPIAVVEVLPHAAAQRRIIDLARDFFDDLEHGREPPSDYILDRDLIGLLSPQEAAATVVDLTFDNEVISGLIERADLKRRMKADHERCEAIEAMVMDRMREAAYARVPDFRVSWKTEQRKAYSVQAKSRRVLRITDQRPDREDDESATTTS